MQAWINKNGSLTNFVRTREMCKETVYQFLSGFLVGVALCFCIVGLWQNLHLVRNIANTNEFMGVQLEVTEGAFLLRMFRQWNKLSERDRYIYEGDKPILHPNNKTVITCLVPLLSDEELGLLESEIIVTWIETCNHVVFLRKRHRVTINIRKTIQNLHFRRHTQKKMSVGYFYMEGNISTADDNISKADDNISKADDNVTQDVQWIRSQYKAVEFASKKYADSILFIITPNIADVVQYFLSSLNENWRDIGFNRLQNLLSTNGSLDSNIVLTLDKSLLLGKTAVSRLIKMTHLNRCSFKNQHLFSKWAHECIKSSNGN